MKMAKVTEQCRDVRELNSLVETMLNLAIKDIVSQGVTPLIVETYRSQERQNYLYCQGRSISECTAKGINRQFAESYCTPKSKKVTWTLNSVHKSRKAVDVVPQRKVNGKMTAIWNANDKQTQIIIKTMQKYGFEAGANWTSNPDSPHFQIKGNFTTTFSSANNTPFITRAIQSKLNERECNKLVVDEKWGKATTDAINRFRECKGYGTVNGKLGAVALKDLFA